MTLKNKIQLLMSYNSWSHIQNYKIITPSSTKKKKISSHPILTGAVQYDTINLDENLHKPHEL